MYFWRFWRSSTFPNIFPFLHFQTAITFCCLDIFDFDIFKKTSIFSDISHIFATCFPVIWYYSMFFDFLTFFEILFRIFRDLILTFFEIFFIFWCSPTYQYFDIFRTFSLFHVSRIIQATYVLFFRLFCITVFFIFF